jgi:hypothetical protein
MNIVDTAPATRHDPGDGTIDTGGAPGARRLRDRLPPARLAQARGAQPVSCPAAFRLCGKLPLVL